jgi:hypothetical protein
LTGRQSRCPHQTGPAAPCMAPAYRQPALQHHGSMSPAWHSSLPALLLPELVMQRTGQQPTKPSAQCCACGAVACCCLRTLSANTRAETDAAARHMHITFQQQFHQRMAPFPWPSSSTQWSALGRQHAGACHQPSHRSSSQPLLLPFVLGWMTHKPCNAHSCPTSPLPSLHFTRELHLEARCCACDLALPGTDQAAGDATPRQLLCSRW